MLDHPQWQSSVLSKEMTAKMWTLQTEATGNTPIYSSLVLGSGEKTGLEKMGIKKTKEGKVNRIQSQEKGSGEKKD